MWSTLVTRAREGAITIQEAYGQLAQKLAKDGTTVADGFLLGFAEIKAKAPSIVHATADLVGGIWQAQGQLFTSVFTNVLTGDFQGLKGTVEGFGKSISGIFAKYFSDILQNWLLTKIGIERNKITGNMEMTGGGSSGGAGGGATSFGGGGVAGFAGAGIGGFGVGSAVGSASGAPGWSTGAAIGGAIGALAVAAYTQMLASVVGSLAAGATVGSSAGIYGAIVGAIVGGVVGILSSSNTEKHVFVEGGKVNSQSRDSASGSILATRDAISGSIVDLFGSTREEGRGVFAK